MGLPIELSSEPLAARTSAPAAPVDQAGAAVVVEAAAGGVLAAPGALVIAAGSVLLIGVLLATTIRLVGAEERLVVRRPGRTPVVRSPGLAVVIPFRDRVIRVDLRPRELDLWWVPGRTGDGVAVTVSGVAIARIVDPAAYVEAGAPTARQTAELIGTHLERLVANSTLTEIAGLTERDLRQVSVSVNGQLAPQGMQVSELDIDRMEIPVSADLVRWADRLAARCCGRPARSGGGRS